MYIKFFLFFTIFVFYFFRIAPTISSGDSAEVIGAGASLGIAHPPGYPTFVILSKIFTVLLPFGDVSYRINFLSLFFSAFAIFIALRISKSYFPLVFASTACFIKQLLNAEVFGLNSFFAILLFYLFKLYIDRDKICYLRLFMLVYGLGLGNQHILLLIAPCFLIWYLLYRQKFLKFSEIISLFFFFVIGLSIYLYLPIRSLKQPIYDWEDPENLSRFLFVVLRKRYGTLQLAMGEPLPLSINFVLGQIKVFIDFILEHFTNFGSLFILLALFLLLVADFKFFLVSFAFILFSGPFFFVLTKTPLTGEHTKFIIERFVSFPFLFLTLAVQNILSQQKLKRILYGNIICVVLALFLINKNIKLNKRDNFIYYDYAKNIIRTIPKNSILFCDRADEMEFSLAYLLNYKKTRNDIEFIDCNAGVTRSIYGQDYYRIWGERRLEIRSKVESEIIKNTEKNVFYATFLPEQTTTSKIQYGLLYEAKHLANFDFPWNEIYVLRKPKKKEIRDLNLFLSYFNLLGQYFLTYNNLESASDCFNTVKLYNKTQIPMIAYLYLKNGFFEQAKVEYEQAINLFPHDDSLYTNLGVVYEKLNMLEKAIEAYEKAIKLNPNSEQAYYNLAVVYWGMRKWKEVVNCFKNVLRINPSNRDAIRYLELASQKLK